MGVGRCVRAQETRGTPSLITSLTLPAIALMLLSLLTCVATVHPDTLPIILALAPHHIVGEVRLSHFMLGVHNHLGTARGRAGSTSAMPGQAGLWHVQQGTEQHPDVQGEGCCVLTEGTLSPEIW